MERTVPIDATGGYSIGTLYAVSNDIPPRYQWNANYGYCGEVSMISAGLYYGQYLSQYDARALAAPGIPQYRYKSQLLLGNNDGAAARRMRLSYERKVTRSSSEFYAWIKQQVVQGRPVLMGVFNNEYLLYHFTNPNNGDSVYDHIVPVVGFGSNYPLTDGYYPDDVIVFSDNGLYTPQNYYYPLEIGAALHDRQAANAVTGDVYSLPADPVTKYGIAITGVMDLHHETLPVRVDTNLDYEFPEIRDNAGARPAPSLLTLTITVSNLTPGVVYNLYRYNQESDVPIEDFNANSKKAGILPWKVIKISSGTTWSMTLKNFKSSNKAFFRVVKA